MLINFIFIGLEESHVGVIVVLQHGSSSLELFLEDPDRLPVNHTA